MKIMFHDAIELCRSHKGFACHTDLNILLALLNLELGGIDEDVVKVFAKSVQESKIEELAEIQNKDKK